MGYNPSFAWRSIHKAQWVLKLGTYWTVGNGLSINIWTDGWLPLQPGHHIWTPKSGLLEDGIVANLIDPELLCWNDHLIRSIFWDFEAAQILDIPIPCHPREDGICWEATKNGLYTVRSGYHFISTHLETNGPSSSGISSEEQASWKQLWKVEGMPQHKHLLWRIRKGCLPVRANLVRKGMNINPLCPRCGNFEETIEHTFFRCQWAKDFWLLYPLCLHPETIDAILVVNWLDKAIKQCDKVALSYLAALVYSIWWSHNKLVFEDKDFPILQSIQIAIYQATQFRTVCLREEAPIASVPSHTTPQWTPPPANCYKLNTDVARIDNENWSAAAIIRDHLGIVFRAATWQFRCGPDACTTESLGLKLGLQFALEMGFMDLIAESDCLPLILAINNPVRGSSPFALLAFDCYCFKLEFHFLRFNHVVRSSNFSAHYLAKFGCSNPNSVEETPHCILAQVNLDRSQISPD